MNTPPATTPHAPHPPGTPATPDGQVPPRPHTPTTRPATSSADTRTPQPTRAHQALTGLITAGAVLIAAIGFTGSYTAVRELAAHQGFGAFSYLFPIGIDAGILILLALDLLLTQLRIPYPLLRHTAWLLTTATIAFNAAAAWPDPLGVGMHAVIPVLFVVVVEAARHAAGRIADITTDQHIESVRLTRWLLSPIPTLLLWRRMKLWELPSYHHALTLEQDRLVYQARLRTRYGRTWRRKAPLQALMPLRLTRYGIPLATTVRADLTATGITPTPTPTTPPQPPKTTPAPQTTAPAEPAAHNPTTEAMPAPPEPAPSTEHHLQPRYRNRPAPPDKAATSHQEDNPFPAAHPQHEPRVSRNTPVHGRQHEARDHRHRGRPQPHQPNRPHHHSTEDADTPPPPHTDHPTPQPPSTTQRETHRATPAPTLTAADHYYLAWHTFQQQHGRPPDAAELSTHLATRGILGAEDQPIKPKALARYLLQFRIYTIWAQHRALSDHPPLEHVIKDLTHHGITGQYNKPLRTPDITKHLTRFEHRWHTLNHTHPPHTQPLNQPHSNAGEPDLGSGNDT
ncbi:DUF2637 domain-containing protein [Streptomyces sp. CA-251387]|uniref:DUF2637 domain-containing protein n=1 Tax=Streptomyces sp. CA-251387 TaxID=3240064 RepID=UPI003D93BEAD